MNIFRNNRSDKKYFSWDLIESGNASCSADRPGEVIVTDTDSMNWIDVSVNSMKCSMGIGSTVTMRR